MAKKSATAAAPAQAAPVQTEQQAAPVQHVLPVNTPSPANLERVYEGLGVEPSIITIMAFPPDPVTGLYPSYPATDEKGRRIFNAYELLETNGSNRKYTEALAERYEQDMLSPNWDTELPIVIYVDWFGQMHNTQHCLNAVIMAEAERTKSPESAQYYADTFGITGPVAISAVMITGINPDSADYLDTGKGRNHQDVTFRKHLFDDVIVQKTTKNGMQSVPVKAAQTQTISGWVATAAKIVWLRIYHGKKLRNSTRFPHSALNEILRKFPALTDSAKFVFTLNEQTKGGISKLVNPAYVVAAHFLATYSDADSSGEFKPHADYMVDILAKGTGVTKESQGQQFYMLREWFMSLKDGSKNNEQLERMYDAMVYAWNNYLAQVPIGDINEFKKLKAAVFPTMGGLDTYIPPAAPVTPVVETPPAPAPITPEQPPQQMALPTMAAPVMPIGPVRQTVAQPAAAAPAAAPAGRNPRAAKATK